MLLKQLANRLMSLRSISVQRFLLNPYGTCYTPIACSLQCVRFKYTPNKGVQGIRNRKSQFESNANQQENEDSEDQENEEFGQSLNLDDR